MPEVVLSHAKKDPRHQNIYVLDRGVQSTRTMKKFSKDTVRFICRAKENTLNSNPLLKMGRIWIWEKA